MARPVQDPITTESTGPMESVTKHPAFAQIGASRVSGRTNLYASDFQHNAYMTITIRRSELHRGLSNDWHFAREELIEVALSEAQWATFVSSPNIGSGVPCTLDHIGGETMPGLPDPDRRDKQFSAEVKRNAESTVQALDELIIEVDGLGLSKVKAEKIKDILARARNTFSSATPWIAKQFDEHMEQTVEKAKAEIHGYVTGALVRSGIAHNGVLPLQLEDNTND